MHWHKDFKAPSSKGTYFIQLSLSNIGLDPTITKDPENNPQYTNPPVVDPRMSMKLILK
jgi:hypothetical protein